MEYTARFYEKNKIDIQNSASAGIGTHVTPWFLADEPAEMTFHLAVGAIGAGGTVDMKLQEADDNIGTNLVDIAGKAITQLADTDDDAGRYLGLTDEQLDIASGKKYCRAIVTVAVAPVVPLAIMTARSVNRYIPVATPVVTVTTI